MLNDTEAKELFDKITITLSGESLEDTIDVLCSYMALIYMVHKDTFDNMDEYLNFISREIVENYNYNVNREEIKEISEQIQIEDKS